MKKRMNQRQWALNFHRAPCVTVWLLVVVFWVQSATILRPTGPLYMGSSTSPLHLILPTSSTKRTHNQTKTNKPYPNAFGACLMVKDDNDLLYEWLAYHYTMLPLGRLVVGSDLGNSQDPQEVLSRWRGMNLESTVLNSDDFINRHGNYSEAFDRDVPFSNEEERTKHHHHALIHRQKGFISTCAELLKAQGVRWTLMIDTDEFLVLNPMTRSEDAVMRSAGTFTKASTATQLRRMIYNATKQNSPFSKVMHALQERDGKNIGGCYTIPRLLVGALENETCPGVENSQKVAKSTINGPISRLSTLRFFQHARKGDFALSKFGKVLVDLGAIDAETVSHQVPANIHRPYKQYCKAAGGAVIAESYFIVLHYVGSWERYASRSDHRRSRAEWEIRSKISDDTSGCAAEVWRWFPLFARRVGKPAAKYLLGYSV